MRASISLPSGRGAYARRRGAASYPAAGSRRMLVAEPRQARSIAEPDPGPLELGREHLRRVRGVPVEVEPAQRAARDVVAAVRGPDLARCRFHIEAPQPGSRRGWNGNSAGTSSVQRPHGRRRRARARRAPADRTTSPGTATRPPRRRRTRMRTARASECGGVGWRSSSGNGSSSRRASTTPCSTASSTTVAAGRRPRSRDRTPPRPGRPPRRACARGKE